MYLTILLPFFNEDKLIENNILQIIEYFKPKFEFEIIIINDSGKANPILERLNSKFDYISILNNKKNFGKGYSLRKGFSLSKGKLVLLCDADLATPIEEFDKLYKFYNQNYQFVIGSRSTVDSKIIIKQSFIRIFTGKIYNYLIKFILGLNFQDTQCGFKLISRSVLDEIIKYTTSNRFGLDIELIYFANKNKYKIYEVGIIWKEKKSSSVSIIKDSFIMLFEILKLRFK